jgi:hypothetical protein
MQKFYDDPQLGIKNEDAPANAVAHGGVSLPPDAVKKKKKAYDGRTREGKQFFKRMAERKAKREAKAKLTKQVQENTLERASHLSEDNLDVLRDIVKRKQHKNVKFKDGNMKVDLFTASAVTKVFDLVNKSNQSKMKDLINGKKSEFMKIANFALSKVK